MKNSIFITIITASLLAACRKHEVQNPSFDVALLEKATYKVGEEVTFNLSGEADQVTFYSGEMLHEYEYSHESRKSMTQSVKVSFRTNVTYNNQPDQFSVDLSTDYNGGGTYQDVLDATWKDDISQQFQIAPEDNPWGSANNFFSGTVDLIDAFEEGKPLYIRFRYKNNPELGIARNWYAYNLNVEASTVLGTKTVFNSYTGFNIVYDKEFTVEDYKNSMVYAGYIMLRLHSAMRPMPTEIWGISPPIYLEEIDHGPDRPDPIKGYRDPMPLEYSYVYEQPGTYTVSFVAYNSSVYGLKETVKQIQLTITE